MKIAVYGRPEFAMMAAFAEGCEVCGHKVVWHRDNVFTADQVEPFDVVAVTGLRGKAREIRDAYVAKGIPVVVIDLGHLRRDLHYRQLGINRLAWVPPFQCADDRWKELAMTNRTRDSKKGDYVLFVGQVPDDASHGMTESEYYAWVEQSVDTLRQNTKLPIHFRPHPDYYVGVRQKLGGLFDKVSARDTPLEDDLRDAHAVATFCSTVGIEALMQGIPVLCDESAPYSDFGHIDFADIKELKAPSEIEVQQFLNRIAYGQWTIDELANGLGPDFILKVITGEIGGEATVTAKDKETEHGSINSSGKRVGTGQRKQLSKRK